VKSGYREEVRCFSESNEAAGRGHEGTTPMYLTYQSCEYREPEFFALARFEVVMAILMFVALLSAQRRKRSLSRDQQYRIQQYLKG